VIFTAWTITANHFSLAPRQTQGSSIMKSSADLKEMPARQPRRHTQARDRSERGIRNYALHLKLMVRMRDSMLALYERYDPKRNTLRWRPV
jgi:hypothetical protein